MNAEAVQICADLGLEPGEMNHHVDHYLEHGERELDRKVAMWWDPSNPKRQQYRQLIRMLIAERKEATL